MKRRRAKVASFILDNSLLLLVGTATAVVWANLAPESYARVADPLHFWVNENQQVAHPVNETMEKVNPLREGGLLPPFVPPLQRASRMVGLLTGLELDEPAQVAGLLREHTAKVHAEAVV